jgi:DNA-binding transcriptional regulator LsrR (DeoR family)
MAVDKKPKRRRPEKPVDSYKRVARESPRDDWQGRTFHELVALACECVARGIPPARIGDELFDRHRIRIRRELAWHLVGFAMCQKLLKYFPPSVYQLEQDLKRAYPALKEVRTVHTGSFEGVALHAAELLIHILRGLRKPEAHIAFAGSYAMRSTAQDFAAQLRTADFPDLPQKIVLHTMVAGFDDDPTVDPLSFCDYFANDPAIRIEFDFVTLRAPPIARPDEHAMLVRDDPLIVEALEGAKDLDVIVTSCARWKDPHSILRQFMERRAPDSCRRLESTCVGDMLSRPIGPDGPLPDVIDGFKLEFRALTLLDLPQLPDFIAGGHRVLLVCGPCGKCAEPKTEILERILHYGLVSDVVVDSRACKELLKSRRPLAAGV